MKLRPNSSSFFARGTRVFSLLASLFAAAFVFLTALSPAVAQDGGDENFLIVFDASGSMWGQIDGTTKIEIAREAFDAARSGLSGRQSAVGLMAYGHRRKGDCGDIELLVDPTTGTIGRVADVVATLTPKGKTPLSDALRQAAERLRHVENRATVVLFSDGVETCNADPCAVAAELEQAGLDFTAHVIGFDISAEADRAQLSCIAENTGGLYRDAGNAADVAAALSEIGRQAVAPEQPVSQMNAFNISLDLAEGTVRPAAVRFKATEVESGAVQLLGKMEGAAEVIAGLRVELPRGAWRIEALSDEGGGVIEIAVTDSMDPVRVPFAAPEVSFSLIDNGPYAIGIKHSFFMKANGPLQGNAELTIGLVPAGGARADMLDWEYRFGSDGPGYIWHDFESPSAPGAYEIVVVDRTGVIDRFPVEYQAEVTPRWNGELKGAPGAALPLRISGNLDSYNGIALLRDGQVVTQTRVSEAYSESGWALQLPDEPGVYDLTYRYDAGQGSQTDVLAQIVVGDVAEADDPDAVDPPAGAAERASSQDEAAGQGASSEDAVMLRCDQPTCRYDNGSGTLAGVPLQNGFELRHETALDNGRPSFELVNPANGDNMIFNPPFMVGTMECVGLTEDGRRAGDDDVPVDRICLGSVNGGADTMAQFEALETWRANENRDAYEADLAQARAAHDATMGEDHIFTSSSLDAGWTISTIDGLEPVAIIGFDLAGEDPSAAQARMLVYAGPETGLTEDTLIDLTVSLLAADTTELMGFMATDSSENRVTLQFTRPPNWDRRDDVFHGMMVVGSTGKVLRVEMF